MRIAIVVPRYGLDVAGGAETQARGLAQEAARRGWDIEVWTTCARSHYSWENVYPAGFQEIEGIVVRRFPITSWNPHLWRALDARLDMQGRLKREEQYDWLETGAHSVPLYAHIARHAAEFDVLVALPYASPLTHYAAWAAPSHCVVWPCLHDEPYAYMEPVRLLLEGVWGVMFNSPEESALALSLLKMRPRHHAVLGEGVLQPPLAMRPEGEMPFDLLYMGRLEGGKNLSVLYDYVRRYADEGSNIRLIVLGRGPLTPPAHSAFDYRGFVSEQTKSRLCASALALCQPSLNESFALTIMESWLSGRPVLVHGDCAVTRGHVERSKGGLWFRSYPEFVGAIEWLRANPDLADRMGQNGRQYVLSNYTWEAVATRFEQLIRRWKTQDG